MIRLAIYGTFRQGGALSHYMDLLRKGGRSSLTKLRGVKMYVVGDCPGAVLTGNEDDRIIVELIENDSFRKQDEEDILTLFDCIEGVDEGLYIRNSVETNDGLTAVIYTYNLPIGKNVSITDWMEWFNNTNNSQKEKAMMCSGNGSIGIRTI